MIKDDIFLDNEMDETLKDLAVCAGYDIKSDLLMKNIYLELPESRWKNDIDVSQVIIKYVNQNRTSKEEEVRTYFKRLLVWICDNEEKARSILPNLCENKHSLLHFHNPFSTENILPYNPVAVPYHKETPACILP